MRCRWVELEFCGLCYEQRRGRASGHGSRPRPVLDRFLSTQEVFDMAMKRPVNGNGGSLGVNEPDHVFFDWYPHLHERMSETKWEDGKPRKVDTLMVFREHSMWKILIHDREARTKAWVSGSSWEEVLKRLEQGLAEETLEWTPEKK